MCKRHPDLSPWSLSVAELHLPTILFFFNYAFPFKKYLLLFIYLAAPVDLVPQPEFEPGPPALGSMES